MRRQRGQIYRLAYPSCERQTAPMSGLKEPTTPPGSRCFPPHWVMRGPHRRGRHWTARCARSRSGRHPSDRQRDELDPLLHLRCDCGGGADHARHPLSLALAAMLWVSSPPPPISSRATKGDRSGIGVSFSLRYTQQPVPPRLRDRTRLAGWLILESLWKYKVFAIAEENSSA